LRATNEVNEALEIREKFGQETATGICQGIVLARRTLGGIDPFGGDEAIAIQASEDGVQGSFLEGDRSSLFEGTK
jgi:hypothetical protein